MISSLLNSRRLRCSEYGRGVFDPLRVSITSLSWTKALLACLAGLAGLAFAPALAGMQAIYESDGKPLFSVTVPDNWIAVAGEDVGPDSPPRVMGLHPEDDYSLWIGFLSPRDAKTLDEAEVYLKGLGSNLVQNATVTRSKDTVWGGMPARLYHGQGTREGAPVDFSVGLVSLPGGRQLIGVFVGEFGARDIYQDQIQAISASIQAAGASQ